MPLDNTAKFKENSHDSLKFGDGVNVQKLAIAVAMVPIIIIPKNPKYEHLISNIECIQNLNGRYSIFSPHFTENVR